MLKLLEEYQTMLYRYKIISLLITPLNLMINMIVLVLNYSTTVAHTNSAVKEVFLSYC